MIYTIIITVVFVVSLYLVTLQKELTMSTSNYILELEKTKAVLLYIVNKLNNADLLKIFKILYFAEQKHLTTYGNLIISDKYVAMKNGPVPSLVYDLFKEIRGDRERIEKNNTFYDAFSVKENSNVIANENANLDYLSTSDIECLNESILENKNLTSKKLSDKSHDYAWDSAPLNNEINSIDIAIAGGANKEMLKYVSECLSNRELISA